MFDHKPYIASAAPQRPGVYRMFGADGELLYVGKARSLKDRVGTYFLASNAHPKVHALVQQITAIEVTVTNSETEALLLEYNLIKAHKPRFNVVLKDDKSFPYIQLCDEHPSHGWPSTAVRAAPADGTSGRSPMPAPCATPSTSCRSCSASATAATASSPTAVARACSTRSAAARRHAWG